MPFPKELAPNDAWIAFRLNAAPLATRADGDYNVMGLLDPVTGLMVGMQLTPADSAEMTPDTARKLLEAGQAYAEQLPRVLLLSHNQPGEVLGAEAQRLGIPVARLPSESLAPLLDRPRFHFAECFPGARLN